LTDTVETYFGLFANPVETFIGLLTSTVKFILNSIGVCNVT
jgi:hypothetical protein